MDKNFLLVLLRRESASSEGVVATVSERKAFGARLRELREAADLSLDQLADAMKDHGEETTASNIGAWERGQYTPRKRRTVAVLEALVGGEGQLATLIGVRVPDVLIATSPDSDHAEGLGHVLGPVEIVEISASGGSIEELRLADPERYAELEALAQFYLDRLQSRRHNP